MTYHYDATGERIEDDDQVLTALGGPPGQLFPTRRAATRDEIHRERIAELRQILAASRQRREGQL